MTNEQRALVPQCSACGAPPGRRCVQHLTSDVYRLVHYPRGKAAGLTPDEVLRLDFGDPPPAEEPPCGIVEIARPLVQLGDDSRLLRRVAEMALDLAEALAPCDLRVKRLRSVLRRVTP